MDKKRYNKYQGVSGKININDIVYITRVAKKVNSPKSYLFCLDIPKLVYTGLRAKIGKPKDYNTNKSNGLFPHDEIDISIPEDVVAKMDEIEAEQTDDHFDEMPQNPASINAHSSYTPIRALNSFVPEWKIKAKISNKGEIKRWSNARGEGYLLNINLIDLNGDMIQATFFKEAVDKFEPILDEGAVYTFSNGSIKNANKKFTTIQNDF